MEYADTGKWFPSAKKIAPAWHGWMHYMYDDVPRVSIIFIELIRKTTS